MLFIDPAFVTFEILNSKWFVISEHRYGAWFTQSFPLIGGWLGLPLRLILILYSASFYILYTIVMWLVGFKWKQYGLATILFFYNILLVSDVFFWPNNEVHQGIAWMILFFGYIKHLTNGVNTIRYYQHAILLVILLLCISSHLLVLIPLGFLWAYFLIDEGRINHLATSSKELFYSIVIGSFALIKNILSRSTSYDKQKLSNFDNITLSSIKGTFFNGHAETVSNLLITEYYILALLALASIIGLLILRKPLLALLTVVSGVVYSFLILLTFPNAFDRNLLFYMESEWMCLSLILTAPLILTIIPRTTFKMLVSGIVILIIGIRFNAIFQSSTYFTQRLEQLEHYTQSLANQQVSKALLNSADHDKNWIMNWGLPLESLILSNINNNEPHVTFKLISSDNVPTIKPYDILTPFYKKNILELNSDYFKLDTTTYYKVFDIGQPITE